MNARDEQGWRIPREGTKSLEVYLLMKEGLRPKKIAETLNDDARSIAVLACYIKRPEKKNSYQRQWHINNPEKSKAIELRSRPNRIVYSKHVKKLVRVLGISFTEAVKIEREIMMKLESAK